MRAELRPWHPGTMRVSGSLCGVLISLLGCGPDAKEMQNDAAVDGERIPPSCAASGAPKAVVASLNGDTDSIAIMKLDGGQLVDTGTRLATPDNPDDVAIRPDGLEALVSFGDVTAGMPYGVVVIDLPIGGAGASVKQTLMVGTGKRPFGLAYASRDRAVLAYAGGPSGHQVIALERNGSDMWTAGMPSAVPNDWPLILERRPRHEEVVLGRSELASDPGMDFYLLQRGGTGAWMPAGSSVTVSPSPISGAVSWDGNQLYSATSDPADPVSSSNLDGAGLFHSVPIGATLGTATTTPLPGPGSTVATDPLGELIVMDSPIYQLSSGRTPTPISYQRRLITIPTEGDVLGTPIAQSTPWDALLLYGLEISTTGLVVRSRQHYFDHMPESEQTPVDVLLPIADGNFVTCSTVFPEGQARFAIAP
jgi:hypothetical protein